MQLSMFEPQSNILFLYLQIRFRRERQSFLDPEDKYQSKIALSLLPTVVEQSFLTVLEMYTTLNR